MIVENINETISKKGNLIDLFNSGEIKYGDFKIGDLFEINPTKYYKLKNDEIISKKGKTPLVSNSSINNGIMGFSNLKPNNVGNTITCSDTTLGTKTMFYQKEDFIGYSHIQHLVPKFEKFNKNIAIFIISICRVLTKDIYDYGNKFNRDIIKKTKIKLPIKKTSNNKDKYTINDIDFEFMENFIAELKTNNLVELNKYLKVNNFINYKLSMEEQKVIDLFNNGEIEYGDFKIGDLFKVNPSKKIFHANGIKNIYKQKEKNIYPYIVRTTNNNGIRGYIRNEEKYLNDKNTLSFAQDTFCVFYQKERYFTGNKVKVLKPLFDEKKQSRNILLYLTNNIQKVFNSFEWGNSSTVNKIYNTEIKLPVKKTSGNKNEYLIDDIDFEFMENFIKAIQKNKIKDIVEYFKQQEKIIY